MESEDFAEGSPLATSWGTFALGQVAVGGTVLAALLVYYHYRVRPSARPKEIVEKVVVPPSERHRSYIPWASREDYAGRFLVVDTTHPEAPSFTHHKGGSTQGTPVHADSSGEIILRALEQGHPALELPFCTCDHFDLDGLVAVWSACNPQPALGEFRELLVEISTIGDFRELDLSRPQAHRALQICCWVNTAERAKFYRPFEKKSESDSSQKKYEYFLPKFGALLRDPERFKGEWEHEYNMVLRDVNLLASEAVVRRHDALGLVVIHAPRRTHYYALFGLTSGFDVVLAVYPGGLFELECKYTAFVDLASRPVHARVAMAPLARVLNRREPVETGATWEANRFVEAGPVLRLERPGERLTKAQRYGHPCDRPIYASALDAEEMERHAVTWLQHGLVGAEEPKHFWTWEELHAHNKALNWAPFYARHGCPCPPPRPEGVVVPPHKTSSCRRKNAPPNRIIELH